LRPVTTKNPYELFNELSESETKEDDGQGGDNENCGNRSVDSSKIDDDSNVAKKKKKKRKGRNKNNLTSSDYEGMEDEVRSSKNSENLATTTAVADSIISPANEEFKKIFTLEYRYLNTEYELKKIFGTKALSLERG
ncbi:unnamed protein product, partial [Allacma fusca]